MTDDSATTINVVAVGTGSCRALFMEGAIAAVPLEPPPSTFGSGVEVKAILASNVGAAMSYSLSETTA